MKFLLDTNVVSELRKGSRAHQGVQDWFSKTQGPDLAISVLVLGEIRLGILRLRPRDPEAAGHLATWCQRLERAYASRTLPIDTKVVAIWSELNAQRSLPVIDSLQASTAMAHGLTLGTRNVSDLAGLDIPVLNPFTDT